MFTHACRLSGTGTVTGTTTIEGLLAPGNSIGSLAMDGDLTLDDGSTFVVEVDDGGNVAGVNNDSVTVSGQLDIDGGASVHVTPEDPAADGSSWAPETTYTILTANQVNGEFGSVSDDFAFLFPQLSYDDENMFLTMIQGSDVASVARTPNQFAVAGAIDTATQDGGLEDIVANVIVMDEDQARAALDDLSGVEHTHVQQIGLRGAQRFRSGLNGRMSGRSSGPAFGEMASLDQLMGLQLASAGQARDLVEGESGPKRGWWVTAEGGQGDIDDTSNASGADYDFGGISVGFDTPVSDNVFVGAAMGYTRNRASIASGDLDVNSFHLAGYGGWQQDALYARGSLGVGYHRADSERSVARLSETATADYSARGIGTGIEMGYVFEVTDAARVTPFGGLDYEYLRRSGFSESGAGAANLDVDSESEYSLRSQAGVRFDQTFDTTGGWVAPYAEAAWVHEHGDRSSRMDTTFSGDSAGQFTIEGPRLSRNRARIALGVQSELNSNSFLNAGYQGEIAGSDLLLATVEARLQQVRRIREKTEDELTDLRRTLNDLGNRKHDPNLEVAAKALDPVATGVILVDTGRRALLFNRAARRMAPGALTLSEGVPPQALHAEEDRRLHQAQRRVLSDCENTGDTIECFRLPRDGHHRDLLAMIYPLPMQKPTPIRDRQVAATTLLPLSCSRIPNDRDGSRRRFWPACSI